MYVMMIHLNKISHS